MWLVQRVRAKTLKRPAKKFLPNSFSSEVLVPNLFLHRVLFGSLQEKINS